MKKFVLQSVLLIAIIIISFFLFRSNFSASNLPFQSEQLTAKELLINNVRLKVEIADTQDKRSKGLGGKPSLATDEGMLFIFPENGRYPFWMKGLNFPLDFVWIKDDKVADLTQNVPQPVVGQPDSSLPIYQSKEDINKVLEVSAGTIQRLNIKVGDVIQIL